MTPRHLCKTLIGSNREARMISVVVAEPLCIGETYVEMALLKNLSPKICVINTGDRGWSVLESRGP